MLRTLELDSMRLKAYIDHLLALILDRNTELLEGMPRTQQSAGMGLDLLAMASLPEVRCVLCPVSFREIDAGFNCTSIIGSVFISCLIL